MDVCILTAGRGTRLGAVGQDLNQGLLPIQGKAVLSHLIERFPEGTRFVVAVGHFASQVREYLALAHPRSRIELVDVPVYEGPGSGPGASALACAGKLPGPFFLVCSDIFWPAGIRLAEPRVSTIWNRSLAYVRERDRFFEGGFESLKRGAGLAAESFEGCLELGTSESYSQARAALEDAHFEKVGERYYHVGERVIRFFSDPAIVRSRVARTRIRPGLFPEIVGSGENFYAYKYIEGKTLYESSNGHDGREVLGNLLAWLQAAVWRRLETPPADFDQRCEEFYRARTEARVSRAETELPAAEREEGSINGIRAPSARALLEALPAASLEGGIAAFIHGDLQLDNVVVSPGSRRFHLIDWRQDFAGVLEYGDLYYDFAKLLASIELDFRAVARGEFAVTRAVGGVRVNLSRLGRWQHLRGVVEDAAVRGQGLDPVRLRVLVGLVFLNMAGIHRGEQARLFYHYGRARLCNALSRSPMEHVPSGHRSG